MLSSLFPWLSSFFFSQKTKTNEANEQIFHIQSKPKTIQIQYPHMTPHLTLQLCLPNEKDIKCDALGDLVAFVQFKKREKHPWRSVNMSKVAGCFLHGCFSRFLSCTNATKSGNESQISKGYKRNRWDWWQLRCCYLHSFVDNIIYPF